MIAAETRPAFLVQAIESELKNSGDGAGKSDLATMLRRRGASFAAARFCRVAGDVVVLWVFCLAFVKLAARAFRIDRFLLVVPLTCLGLVLAWIVRAKLPGFWMNLAAAGLVAGGAVSYLHFRGHESLVTFRAVALASCIPTGAFVLRQAVMVVFGRDPGQVTLGTMLAWNATLSHFGGHLDLFGLLWGFYVSHGLARITGRSYGWTAAVVSAVNAAAMYIGGQKFLG